MRGTPFGDWGAPLDDLSLDGASDRVFDGCMSRATIVSGTTAFLAAVLAVVTADQGIAVLFNTVWLLSAAALLVAVALDVRRKRYWSLLVVVGLAVVSAIGLLFLYVVANAVVVD